MTASPPDYEYVSATASGEQQPNQYSYPYGANNAGSDINGANNVGHDIDGTYTNPVESSDIYEEIRNEVAMF